MGCCARSDGDARVRKVGIGLLQCGVDVDVDLMGFTVESERAKQQAALHLICSCTHFPVKFGPRSPEGL